MNQIIPDAGVHHVAVHTLDYAGTLRFYQEVLGMTAVAEWQAADGRQLALLDIGNGSHLEVIGFGDGVERPAGGQHHPFMHLAIATSDPDAVWRRATEAGSPSVLEPKDVSLGGIPARIAFIEGPNGETIEFFRQG